MKKRRSRRALLSVLVLGGLLLMATIGASTAAADTSALSITKTMDPVQPVAGSYATYTISVHNNGPDADTGVTVTDNLPASVSYVSDTDGCTGAPNLSCPVGNLANGATYSFDVLVKVLSSATGTISNTASVDGANDGDNTSATRTSSVLASADLSVTKLCKPDSTSVPVGGNGTCTITIVNSGPSDAATVTLTDQITANHNFNITNVAITPSGGTCTSSATLPAANTTETCTGLGPLAAGAQKKIVFTFTNATDPVLPLDVDDAATVSSDTPDPNHSNDTATGGLSFAGPAADLSVLKTCAPSTPVITPGSTGTCEIVVHNGGPDAAASLALTDHLSSNGSFAVHSATANLGSCGAVPALDATTSSSTVTCTTPSLNSGSDWVIDIVITSLSGVTVNDTATATSATPDPDSGNNAASAGLTFSYSADLSVTKDCKPDTSLPAGTNATCQIFIVNNGPSAVQAGDTITLKEHLISNGPFKIESITIPGDMNCSQPAPPEIVVTSGNVTITCTSTAGLAVNDDREIDVVITSDVGVSVDDTARVFSTVSDPDSSNNTRSDGVIFTASADLSIQKADSPDPVVAGQNVTYTLTAANAGPSPATGVVVVDTLPAGESFVSATPSVGSFGVNGNVVTWTIGNLAVGGPSPTLQLVAHVDPSATGTLTNTATISADTGDPNSANNTATQQTTINVTTGLNITKTDSPDPVIAGSNLTWTIVASNAGPSTAAGVVVTDDPLPTGTTYVSGVDQTDATQCTFVQPARVVCALGSLLPGQSKTVLITVHVASNVPDGQNLPNCADITTTSGNDTDEGCANTTVHTSADLWIDKQGTAPAQNPAGALIYTITVHNAPGCVSDSTITCGTGGPSDAQNVRVTDPLPLTPKKLKVQFMDQGCTYSSGTHTVTCTQATIQYGGTKTWHIQVQVQGTQKYTLSNTATITHSDTPDPSSSNNSDTVSNVVQGSTGQTKKP